MPRRRCLDWRPDFPPAGCLTFTSTGSRCGPCRAGLKRLRNADRKIAAAVVAASPVCADCGATDDLTADHDLPLIRTRTNAGKRRVLCRPCNSKKADRARSS